MVECGHRRDWETTSWQEKERDLDLCEVRAEACGMPGDVWANEVQANMALEAHAHQVEAFHRGTFTCEKAAALLAE